jgi:polar amino acid transport system substrate-binding protein
MHWTAPVGRAIASLVMMLLLVPACGGGNGAAPGTKCGGETINGIAVPAQSASPTIAEICKNGVLKDGVAVGFPVLLQDPKTGQYFGAAISIIKRVASLLHVKVQFIDSGYDVIMAGLQSDKFQIAGAALYASEKRKEVADFVNYYKAGSCYATSKSNSSFTSISDLKSTNQTVLGITGSGSLEAFQEQYPNVKTVSVVAPPGGQIAGIDEILAGRAQIAIIDDSTSKVVTQKYPQIKIVPNVKDCLINPDLALPVGMAYRKGDTEMGNFLTAVVSMMQNQINDEIIKYSDPKYYT